MAAPIPREAPVTSATLPSSGFAQSAGAEAVLVSVPTRMTWASTKADFDDSKNRSVDSVASSAPSATYTS